MLDDMLALAQDYLSDELGEALFDQASRTPAGMPRLHRTPGLNRYLVEASEKIKRAYLLIPDEKDRELVRLEAFELDEETGERLPFIKMPGANSPALGPVLKRTFNAAKKEPSPSSRTVQSSLDAFAAIAEQEGIWQSYFCTIVEVLARPKLKLPDGEIVTTGAGKKYANIIDVAISRIDEKPTVFLAVADKQGRWPGDVREYRDFLASGEVAKKKYTTNEAPPHESCECALCQIEETTVFANAVKGAGLNLMNVDRAGAFPGIDTDNSWKSYALCVNCADLLYIYKNHVAAKFISYIAGSKALLIPSTGLSGKTRQGFMREMKRYVDSLGKGVEQRELNLLDFIAEAPDHVGVTSLTLIWAKFGQNIEDLHGAITDILPSRLGKLSQINRKFNHRHHPLFPTIEHLNYSLGMQILADIFRRPGGKKNTSLNDSKRLFQLKRTLLAALYHGQSLQATRFWDEILTTARCHLDEIAINNNTYGLQHETTGDYKGYLTLASWVRHLAKLLFYFQMTEVFSMQENEWYQPQLEKLRSYFGPESGINSREKAFAFLLGIVYGKLLAVQGGRGVNVSSNALTWLKRLTLSGRDLPEFYVKVREKLLAYGTEGSTQVRELLQEIAVLGAKLGDKIDLNETQTCYYLLLGQSLASEILPKKSEQGE
jgi:CRISPR-associated protein Csh1